MHDLGSRRCCNDLPNQHATAHFHSQQHPIIQSYGPGEDWWYCYIDDLAFGVDRRERALLSMLALNELRISEALGDNIDDVTLSATPWRRGTHQLPRCQLRNVVR